MKKRRAGFSLVEVVCAMAIVALISGVVIMTLASSRNITNMSQSSIDASREAQNVVECYTSAKKGPDGLADDSFLDNLGVYYGFDRDAMGGRYSVSEIVGGSDGQTVTGRKYVFYYGSKFELLTAPASARAGGYDFRLEMTVYTGASDNAGMKITVTGFDANPAKEKIVYKYGAEE